MISKSLKEMTKCRWREFRREPSAFFWVIFMPILWMVVLGIAFSDPKPERYGVGWIKGTELPQAKNALEDSKEVKLREGTPEELGTWFRRGEIVISVEQQNNTTTYTYDITNPESVRAKRYVDLLIQQAYGQQKPMITQDKQRDAKGERYIDFLIPGLLGLSIMSSSLFGTGMTIVSNRKENLLKRYLATPMRKYEFLVSHIFGRFIILFFEYAAIAISGYLIFGFGLAGNMLAYILIAILGAAMFTAIALVCASRTASVPFMGGLVNAISIPLVLLSGVFFSKTNFPDAMQPFLKLLPLTALNDALRKIALEGASLFSISQEVIVMLVYLIVSVVVSRALFRWY